MKKKKYSQSVKSNKYLMRINYETKMKDDR